MIGSQLGNYRVFERIGEGGMGTVYRATDVMLERSVALKFLHPDLARQPELVGRFRAEAVVLARLVHPHVAAVYGLHKHDDDLYMAMEYVPGRTLAEHLKEVGHLTAGTSLRIVFDVLDALDYAHGQGVVHRDIKSANIMVTPGGAIKVMDFGIARVLGGERRTMVGTIVGTLGYMSPEQIQGLDIDGRSDLYSLGIVLYELLTGRVPFEAETEWALMQAQIQQHPAPPASLVAMPEALDAVIMKALAKSRDERFQSAREFHEALVPIFQAVATPEERVAFARANREAAVSGRFAAEAPSPRASSAGEGAGTTAFDETLVRMPPIRPPSSPSIEVEATRLLGTPVPVSLEPKARSLEPGARSLEAGARSLEPATPVAAAAMATAAASAPVAAPTAAPIAAPVPRAAKAAKGGSPRAAAPVSRLLFGVGILALVAAVAGGAWWVTQAGTGVPLPAVSAPSASSAVVGEAFTAPAAPDASAIENVPVAPRAAPDAAAPSELPPVEATAVGEGAMPAAPAAPDPPAVAASAPAAPATPGPAERFERVKLLRRSSQGDAVEVDGILVVEPARITVFNVNGSHPLLAFSVPTITSATYAETSQRRVFVRARRHWLTLVTGGRNMEVRLTKEQAPAVVAAVERVLGRPVTREIAPE